MNIKIISKSEFLKQNKKPNQEQVWDSIASAWNKYVVKKIPIVEEFLKKASSFSENNETAKIVDLGCGDGRNMSPNMNIEYWGVDFSSLSLEHAKKRAEKEKINTENSLNYLSLDSRGTGGGFSEFSVSEISNKPHTLVCGKTQEISDVKLFKSKIDKLPKEFKDKMFDYGLFIASLHCLETPKERTDSLKEFYRILKTNAEALISIWNSEDKRFRCVKNQGDIYMSWRENQISYMRYYYLFKKQEFIDALEKVGFKILEFYKPREHDRFSKKNWSVRVIK